MPSCSLNYGKCSMNSKKRSKTRTKKPKLVKATPIEELTIKDVVAMIGRCENQMRLLNFRLRSVEQTASRLGDSIQFKRIAQAAEMDAELVRDNPFAGAYVANGAL